MKCEFELVFNDYQYCPFITSMLLDNKTKISWSNFSEKRISDFKDKGYTFNHIAEMLIITIAIKLDMTHDFHPNHIMCALEWKLNAMINRDKNLIKKLPVDWAHPLKIKFESYRV